MIYKETYQFLLHNVSSREFDACLYSLLKIDWDGVIHATSQEVAEAIGSKKKYLKQIVKKYSKLLSRKVLVPFKDKYILNIGKHKNLGFKKITDLYCKKYSFFYTPEFRSLPLNAKRLILMGAFEMSISETEKLVIDYNNIVPSKRSEGNSFFTRGRLLNAIQAIQNSPFKRFVNVSMFSTIHDRQELVSFSFEDGTLKKFEKNHTERTLLRQKMLKAGFLELLSDDFCKDIQSVGKSIFNKLTKLEKENSKKRGLVCGVKEDLLEIARLVYDRSIKKMAIAMNKPKNKHFLTETKEASAYFSAIVRDELTQEMLKYQNQVDSYKDLLSSTKYLRGYQMEMQYDEETGKALLVDSLETVNQTVLDLEKNERIALILSEWDAEWVMARANTVLYEKNNEDESLEEAAPTKKRVWNTKEEAVKYLKSVKKSAYKQISKLIALISENGIPTQTEGVLANRFKEFKDERRETVANRLKGLVERRKEYKSYFDKLSEKITIA
ncbi:hypothetical protein [Priestia megaterium]|uniref:Uncharacterized protein n=1 Tax=Priestia megaterium TaxID=1404 RepID=A0A6M6E8L0_PRIMG|nr:hypothetical protein [Priestia megaterium]QJX80758.1 hypothetical protein FDZ14_32220 [Priestia megaterium]